MLECGLAQKTARQIRRPTQIWQLRVNGGRAGPVSIVSQEHGPAGCQLLPCALRNTGGIMSEAEQAPNKLRAADRQTGAAVINGLAATYEVD